MAAFLWAVGANYTVGRYSGERGLGYDLTSRYEGHEVEAQLDVARLIGAVSTNDLPELWVTAEDRVNCAALLQDLGLDRPSRWPACTPVPSGQKPAGHSNALPWWVDGSP